MSYEGAVQYETKIPLVINNYDIEQLATRKYLKGEASPLVCLERQPLGAKENELYSGEELLPGVFASTVNFSVSKADLPADLPKAEKEEMFIELYDKNGHLIHASTDNMEDEMTKLFNKADETTETVSEPFTQRFPVDRGGDYRIVVNAPFAAYTHTEDFTVKTTPEYALNLPEESSKINRDVEFYAFFTTGYPYQPEQFADNLYARYTLTNTEGTVISQQNKALNFAQPTTPNTCRAGCDTIGFTSYELEPGRYTLAYESNFETAEGRLSGTFDFEVTDVLVIKLRCSNSQPRPDEVINLNGVCRYGYPYIKPDERYPKPTFRLLYELSYTDIDNNIFEVFDEGELVYTHDSLAVSTINQRFTIPFDMRKVSAAYHNLPLELSVTGYSGSKILTSHGTTVKIVNAASAIKEIDDRRSRIENDIYDLQGRKVKTTQKGIYITNGKKVVR